MILSVKAADSPSAMQAPTKLFADENTIQIGWQPPSDTGYSDIVGYKVYWNEGGHQNLFEVPLHDTGSADILTFTIVAPQIETGQTYWFAVAAYNDIFTSEKSPIAQIISGTEPAQPDPVRRLNSALTAITIEWDAPYDGGSPITNYLIQSNMGDGTTFIQIGVTGAGSTSYQALSLSTSQIYEFRVVAVNDVGESLPSTPTPLVIATTPSQPGQPEKQLSTLTSISIVWEKPASDGGSPVINYAVKLESSAGAGFSIIGYTDVEQFTQEGLTSGTEYYFQIVAINLVGDSADSLAGMIICGTVPGQPPKPTLVSQTATSVSFAYEPAVNIGEPEVIGWKIQWNEGNGYVFSTLATLNDADQLVFSKTNNIHYGITYDFKVVAVNSVGDSVPSPILEILAAQPPNAPLNLVKYSSDQTSITVSWQAPDYNGGTEILGYYIYWDDATTSLLPTSIGQTNWQTLSFSKAGLSTDSYYIFAVTAYNVIGESL
jgi:titin